MDVYDSIASRRSVRHFDVKPVSRVTLERVLATTTLAPSARNEQPWRFYVAEGDTRLELGRVVSQTTAYIREYVDALGPEGYDRAVAWYSSLGDAPVLIAVTAPDSEDEFTATNRMLSIGAAIENLLLAATAEGLGTCVFTFSYWVKTELARVLSLSDACSVCCVIAVGWPSPDDRPRPERRSDVAVWLD